MFLEGRLNFSVVFDGSTRVFLRPSAILFQSDNVFRRTSLLPSQSGCISGMYVNG